MKHEIKNVTKSQLNNLIEEYVVGFKAERNREILKDHYVLGMTFEEVAEKHDMSVSQIKKITYDNEIIILNHLRAE